MLFYLWFCRPASITTQEFILLSKDIPSPCRAGGYFCCYTTKKRLLSYRSLRGDSGIRTHDLLHAMQALSQLSYTPISSRTTHMRLLYNTIKGNRNQVLFLIFCCCASSALSGICMAEHQKNPEGLSPFGILLSMSTAYVLTAPLGINRFRTEQPASPGTRSGP